MKNKEIIEGNKLIAQFMGLPYVGKNVSGFRGYVFDLTAGKIKGNFLCYANTESMEYHSNWSWLMPIVEKIESMKHPVYISSNSCVIYEKVGKNFGWVIDQYGKTKIEAVWNAIVEFIKSENKLKIN